MASAVPSLGLPWDDGSGVTAASGGASAEGAARLTRQRARRQQGAAATTADCRLDRLFRQLQQPLFQLQGPLPATSAATAASVRPVTAETVFAPVDGWAKIPHGVWLREATAVAVDSTDRWAATIRSAPTLPLPRAMVMTLLAVRAALSVYCRHRVYVFNRGNVPVLIFDSAGNLLNKWGNATPGLGTETIPSTGDTMPVINRWKGSEFIRPHAITIDHEDNLWLVDDDANIITKCDRDGNRVRACAPLMHWNAVCSLEPQRTAVD
eukprot:COSAG06_NODE_8935_length_2028_cov_3.504925_3_plen_266_part_00